MRRFKAEVHNLLDTFYKTAAVGALCFDQNLELIACVPESRLEQNLALLGVSEIVDFFKKIAGQGSKPQRKYYTFISRFNFVSNAVPVYCGSNLLGILFTEPVIMRKSNAESLSAPAGFKDFPTLTQRTLETAFSEMSIISNDRIVSMGRVLYSLTQSFLLDDIPLQALHRETARGTPSGINDSIIRESRRSAAPFKHLSYCSYLKMKNAIQSGNTSELLKLISVINLDDISVEQLSSADFLRSMKDGLIKFCSLSCYAAIDAGADYGKVIGQLDSFILRTESLSSVRDIDELIQTAMITFSRAVLTSSVPYTKPVSQVMEYITAHYAEKISLKQLAEHTNLSTFYLSSLLRKETGLMLSDNINKVRVEKSKQLLQDENISILEVALMVGFTHQNQYTVIFKKFIGMTPSEFRKSLGNPGFSSISSKKHLHLPQIVYSQICNLLRPLPELYDIARIVDPIHHGSWLIEDQRVRCRPESYYQFWQHSESSTDCISQKTFLKNQLAFKIEHRDDSVFLILAIPKHFDEGTYILELLKEFPETDTLSNPAELLNGME